MVRGIEDLPPHHVTMRPKQAAAAQTQIVIGAFLNLILDSIESIMKGRSRHIEYLCSAVDI
jgi:hypothetical protein